MLNIQDVEQFHRAFGHPVKTESEYLKHFPKDGFFNDDGTYKDETALLKLRLDLIREEADELRDAYFGRDPVLFADALFDLLYVTYGAIIALGVPRAIGDIVHNSNMSKGVKCPYADATGHSDMYHCGECNDTGIVPILREDGKILKGPNWIDDKPLIAACIEKECK